MPDQLRYDSVRFPRSEFDYQTLLGLLKDYSHPRDKITDLLRKKRIIRVKKGLYVVGESSVARPYSKELLANLIYGPSYISLEFALGYYGMIPERVEAVTSVTTGRSRRFNTPLGLFTYRSIPLPAFQVGMTRVAHEDGAAFLIATAEKALCDKIRDDRGVQLRSRKDMKAYLFENLRIDPESLVTLKPEAVGEIAKRYGSAKLRLLRSIIEDLEDHG